MPQRARSGSASSHASSSASSSSSSAGDEHADALAALQAHGADFLAACGMAPAATSSSSAAAGKQPESRVPSSEALAPSGPSKRASGSTAAGAQTSSSTAGAVAPASSEVRAGKKRAREPVTVVFEQTGRRRPVDEASGGDVQRGSARDFMSSKVQRVHTAQAASSARKSGVTSEDEADEKAARANDKELSHLLSTTLFAPGAGGASSSARGLSHGDTAARLAELGASKKELRGATVGRGWGEAKVRAQDMASMPAHMRAGMRRKEVERQEKRVELAKELGTYHPSLKNVKEAGSDLILGTRRLEKEQRTRQKGVGMGVGTFANGTLTIGKAERQRIEGSGGRGGKTRGRGGRGGGGRGGKRGRA